MSRAATPSPPDALASASIAPSPMWSVPKAPGSIITFSLLGRCLVADLTFPRRPPGVQHLSRADYHRDCVNDIGGPIGNELDIRALRYFVVAAEELNFTRAAARLFVAQQALSREIQRLERQLETQLFVRTTRRVTLTPDGERLLLKARELIGQHDAVWAELHRSAAKPTTVDLMSEGRRTAPRILELARTSSPSLEFRGRYTGGTGTALDRLQTGELDVVIGRIDWRNAPRKASIGRSLIRLEPLAVLLPADHPLAERDVVPVRSLNGREIDGLPLDQGAPEWADLLSQFLELAGAHSTPPHMPAIGLEDQGYHLVRQGVPILTSIDHVDVPGGVLRPLVDPVPLYAWSLAWRRDAVTDGVRAIQSAAAELGRSEAWLEAGGEGSDDTWLPEPEASDLGGDRRSG
jgi:DNA-binding transcriptional LysR family regulator